MNITKLFKHFLTNSQSSGILLILCVIISLIIANSSNAEIFQSFLHYPLGIYSVKVWINDGLMAIFFLLVGLEIKREMLGGELSSFKNASLPIFAAIGGMIVPAMIFTLFNNGTHFDKGWAIPMATDIAFSLAIVSMLGKSVPTAVKVFLSALAIVDDLGAIIVIAIFYTDTIEWNYLLYSGGIITFLAILNYFNVRKYIFYLIPGIALWYFMHHSGIHATIAGVLLAFMIPNSKNTENENSPLEKLEHTLHTPVSYIILPIFALASTNITFKEGMVDGLFSSLGYGIILGLVLGKLIGVNLFSFIAIKLKISSLPDKSTWSHMLGVGLLAGIGFTMSIFITLLSYKEVNLQDQAKFAILVASILAGLLGYLCLKYIAKNGNN